MLTNIQNAFIFHHAFGACFVCEEVSFTFLLLSCAAGEYLVSHFSTSFQSFSRWVWYSLIHIVQFLVSIFFIFSLQSSLSCHHSFLSSVVQFLFAFNRSNNIFYFISFTLMFFLENALLSKCLSLFQANVVFTSFIILLFFTFIVTVVFVFLYSMRHRSEILTVAKIPDLKPRSAT